MLLHWCNIARQMLQQLSLTLKRPEVLVSAAGCGVFCVAVLSLKDLRAQEKVIME